MKANPGGQLAPGDVVGRDELIRRLWNVLERQSVVLTAERRIGKTSFIKKMVAEAPESVIPIYQDLEGTRTPLEFAELVLHDVEDYLSRKGRLASRARKLLAELAGAEIGDVIKVPEQVAPHWKKLLKMVIEDLAEHQDRTLLFFWDEVPLMLYNIKRRDGEATRARSSALLSWRHSMCSLPKSRFRSPISSTGSSCMRSSRTARLRAFEIR